MERKFCFPKTVVFLNVRLLLSIPGATGETVDGLEVDASNGSVVGTSRDVAEGVTSTVDATLTVGVTSTFGMMSTVGATSTVKLVDWFSNFA